MGSSPRDGLYLTVEDGVPQGEACEDGVCHAAPADRSTVGEKRHCSVTGGHLPWTRDSTRPRVLRRDPEAELKLSGCSDALFPGFLFTTCSPSPTGRPGGARRTSPMGCATGWSTSSHGGRPTCPSTGASTPASSAPVRRLPGRRVDRALKRQPDQESCSGRVRAKEKAYGDPGGAQGVPDVAWRRRWRVAEWMLRPQPRVCHPQ
jgi:hypothetical protein